MRYTTEVAVAKTVGEIQAMLVAHGARSVLLEYEKGDAMGITFSLDTPMGRQAFKLPANVSGVWRVMQQQFHEGKIERRYLSEAQARRVAWRIVKEWLQAQLALIEAEVVSTDQVLLPYLIVDRESRQTLYEAVAEGKLPKLLPPPAGAPDQSRE